MASISGYGVDLSAAAALLREHFELPFVDAMNRDNTLYNRFRKITTVGQEYQTKVHYAGNSSAGSYAETDVAHAPGSQAYVPLVIPMFFNQVTYGATGVAQAATRGGGGFMETLANEARESLPDLQNALNSQILAFTKAEATDMDGIGVIVSDTGTYGTIDRSTYLWFKSYVVANGAAPRALTIALMEDQLAELEKPARRAKVTSVMTSRKHYNQYGNLMVDQRRFGPKDRLDGGVQVLEFESIPVIPVPGIADGSMFFLDENEWAYCVLKNFDTKPLYLNGDADSFLTTHYANLICKHTGRQGRIDDLS